MKIDAHAHFYPRTYADHVKPFFEKDDSPAGRDVQRILAWVGGEPKMWSEEQRLEDMARLGIDTQVLSVSVPNVYVPDRSAAVELCQSANDHLVDVAKRNPDRFKVFASLPLHYPEEAARELDRVAGSAEVVGVVLGARVAGRMLDDAGFLPLYGELERRGVPIFLHPMGALGDECMMEYGLANMAGYLFETTTSVLRLVFAGVFERHPNLTLIFPHLGGVAPYMLGRAQWSYERFPANSEHITAPPLEYFKRFYYDTVSRNVPALKMALEMFGVGHILFGTDYPFREDVQPQIQDIDDLKLSEEDAEAVLWKNASTLLKLG